MHTVVLADMRVATLRYVFNNNGASCGAESGCRNGTVARGRSDPSDLSLIAGVVGSVFFA